VKGLAAKEKIKKKAKKRHPPKPFSEPGWPFPTLSLQANL